MRRCYRSGRKTDNRPKVPRSPAALAQGLGFVGGLPSAFGFDQVLGVVGTGGDLMALDRGPAGQLLLHLAPGDAAMRIPFDGVAGAELVAHAVLLVHCSAAMMGSRPPRRCEPGVCNATEASAAAGARCA